MVIFPRVIYRGDWDPTRTDAVKSQPCHSAGDFTKAQAQGWRLDPTGQTADADYGDLNDPAETKASAPVGQYPKRRGRPPAEKP
jgi:hypothetical protein